ncbi:hypothetical protein YC2023_054103 [Brassica napus]
MKLSQPIHLSKLKQPIRRLQYATSLTPTIDRSTTPLALPLGNFISLQFAVKSVDLSSFYHWTKYLPPVLQRYTDVTEKLTRLDPVMLSATKGTYP